MSNDKTRQPFLGCRIPDRWEMVDPKIKIDGYGWGAVIRNECTGVECFFDGWSIRSLPKEMRQS